MTAAHASDGAEPALFPHCIETDRLRLERLGPENPDPLTFYEHTNGDVPTIDESTRYVTWEPNRTPNAGATFLERAAAANDDAETATYCIRPAAGEEGADEFAGTTGMTVDWERGEANFGIWLRKPFWGRGYSGERADALLELAFARLDLDCVAVSHYPENENSQRAIERYVERHGGRREGTFRNRVSDSTGATHDVVRYTITQPEWAAADGAKTTVSFGD